ncbi:hypothetical protein PGT21_016423 [Puccinia graminis f. sp. tritici]|uniref:Uncharacterized protein n=1 Tax=Puccinia graminis f. sp. tritici TaxID=56615 RepID=A0A5B0P6M0_PUCGR|nr:hypothetical protein PGT21_016423 [Puccinia graminis f. sp. tritici]KAA1132012.1 hypothetical protein PGTUg99_035689 [Puccinia graminis f. sp. tritici]
MKRTKKRPRQRSPSPSPTPLGRSDARPQSTQSNAADSDIVVNDGSDTTSGLQSRASQTRQANNSLDPTDHDELLRAQKTASNAVSAAYANYNTPELSTQLDKKGRRMIAYPCKM